MNPTLRARNHPGYWAFLVHRVSGILLALYLPAHFCVLGLALHDAARLDAFLRWTDQPLVRFGEWGLVLLLAAHFTVGASGGVLGGAWTAYGVRGGVDLVLVNGTVAKPWPPPGPPPECPAMPFWPVYNGTLDRVLSPGPYTVYWDTGYCGVPTEILVTQTVQVLPA